VAPARRAILPHTRTAGVSQRRPRTVGDHTGTCWNVRNIDHPSTAGAGTISKLSLNGSLRTLSAITRADVRERSRKLCDDASGWLFTRALSHGPFSLPILADLFAHLCAPLSAPLSLRPSLCALLSAPLSLRISAPAHPARFAHAGTARTSALSLSIRPLSLSLSHAAGLGETSPQKFAPANPV
jgi:hypothetical protein